MVTIESGKRPTVTTEAILYAYERGYYPMARGANGEIEFCAFEPRGIIPLDDRFTVRKSLRHFLRNHPYRVTRDCAFAEVIKRCSRHNKLVDSEVWLSNEMISLYGELHAQGIAHSVEVWDSDGSEAILVGGLYGLHLGGAFCGESMFSARRYASQVALVRLVEHLRTQGFQLLDAQMSSDHLKQFGLYEVSQREYLKLLDKALAQPVLF